jgi:hypothetical protein
MVASQRRGVYGVNTRSRAGTSTVMEAGAGLANPYPGLTGRSERVDTFEAMRFLVVAFSSLALIVLVVPSHV